MYMLMVLTLMELMPATVAATVLEAAGPLGHEVRLITIAREGKRRIAPSSARMLKVNDTDMPCTVLAKVAAAYVLERNRALLEHSQHTRDALGEFDSLREARMSCAPGVTQPDYVQVVHGCKHVRGDVICLQLEQQVPLRRVALARCHRAEALRVLVVVQIRLFDDRPARRMSELDNHVTPIMVTFEIPPA